MNTAQRIINEAQGSFSRAAYLTYRESWLELSHDADPTAATVVFTDGSRLRFDTDERTFIEVTE